MRVPTYIADIANSYRLIYSILLGVLSKKQCTCIVLVEGGIELYVDLA